MVNVCKGVCVRIEGATISGRGARLGQKRCMICSYRVKTDELRCPCCKTKYRIKIRRTSHTIQIRI